MKFYNSLVLYKFKIYVLSRYKLNTRHRNYFNSFFFFSLHFVGMEVSGSERGEGKIVTIWSWKWRNVGE